MFLNVRAVRKDITDHMIIHHPHVGRVPMDSIRGAMVPDIAFVERVLTLRIPHPSVIIRNHQARMANVCGVQPDTIRMQMRTQLVQLAGVSTALMGKYLSTLPFIMATRMPTVIPNVLIALRVSISQRKPYSQPFLVTRVQQVVASRLATTAYPVNTVTRKQTHVLIVQKDLNNHWVPAVFVNRVSPAGETLVTTRAGSYVL